ncbi:uncharacterized protein LOC141590355 [Silene latifolia]|uniref:uncharacterized protein LOC141590355 n=1 Tax=Silene latifolia TaxID=37657 RepID=UPI003D781F0D
MFDNKPVIIREWTPTTDMVKEKLEKLPIWVKFVGLDLKFWGKTYLHKLGGQIGTVIRRDEATEKKMFLGYARLMIEVKVNQQFPESLSFMDEEGKERKVRLEYDWLPMTCNTCRGIGHATGQCRKKANTQKVTQVWRKKVVPAATVLATPKDGVVGTIGANRG